MIEVDYKAAVTHTRSEKVGKVKVAFEVGEDLGYAGNYG